jgi:CRP-like cAMP-binding protein
VTIPWDRSPLFHLVPAAALDELFRHGVHRHFEPGEAVCRAGDPGASLYLVEAGLLHVVRPVDDALLARVRPGNFLGEAAPLTGEPRSATVLARVPSDVVELPREAFLDVAERHPMLLANLAGLVSQRLVARTSRHGLGDRHETAAVILDAEPFRASEVVAATQAATPGAVGAVDLTGSPLLAQQALARLEDAAAQPGITLLLVRPDTADLRVLLDYADRVVALTDPSGAARLAQALPAGRVEHVPPDRRGWAGSAATWRILG